jgi:hypothetical protein
MTRRALIVGFDRLASPLAVLLSDERWECRYSRVGGTLASLSTDLVFQVGGGPTVFPRILAACQFFGKPLIKLWVGTDVTRLANPKILEPYRRNSVYHWAVAPWLAEELKQYGIDSRVVPLSKLERTQTQPLPPPPLTLISYTPDKKFDFYGGPLMLELAKRFADVRFMAVACEGTGIAAPPNVEFLGYRSDMQAIYAHTHALVRHVRHDGLSYMVLEALEAGRHVVWDRPMPGVRVAHTKQDVADEVERLRSACIDGRLSVNQEGITFARSTYLGSMVSAQIRDGFDSVIAAHEERNAS